MPTLKVISNSGSGGQTGKGWTEGTYKARFVFQQATAATGSGSFVVPYAGTIVGVFASELCTQSSDRTDTITVAKRGKNTATSADVAVLGTAGVLSSNNVSGTITRSIGTSGVTAFTGSTNPVLSTVAGALDVAAGDVITVTNTTAGANGSAATQLSVVVEVEYNLGDDTALN